MTDEEWEAYHRAMASYQRQIDTTDRVGGRYGRIARPSPPSAPSRRHPGPGPRFAKPRGAGATIRDRDELRRRFCDWRRSTTERSTQELFAAHLGVDPRTLRGYCHDYDTPWTELLRLTCP